MGGIDLDPASCAEANKVVKAKKFYTMKDDGLKQPWLGRVFLNPPFKTSIIKPFTKKLIHAYESQEIEQAIFLCNASTDSQWWHKVLESSGLVCLPRLRTKFYGPKAKGTPSQVGQSLFYFGDHMGRFGVVFSRFGIVVGDATQFVIDMYEDEEEAARR
jgi:ParB family transcriptional regulator, chromosome partitioning protein